MKNKPPDTYLLGMNTALVMEIESTTRLKRNISFMKMPTLDMPPKHLLVY